MLEDVIQLHRSGRLEEAEQGYRQLLVEHPQDAEVLHLLGILRAQRGHGPEGLELVARAGELAPDNAACRHTLGEMYLGAGRLDDAERAYEQARQLNPNLAAAHGGLGQIALLRGDVAAAESHFKVALRADENDVQAVTGLGNVANARGDSARALQLFTQAAELAPNDPLIQASYAQAMLDQGMLDFAAKALDNALAVKPDYALAQALRADLHVRKGDFATAAPLFEALLARGDQVAAAHAGLGDIARAQGRFDAAIAHYDQALQVQPDLHHVATRRGDSLSRSGRVDDAIEAMRAHIQRYPDAHKAYLGLASLYSQTGRHDAALAVWSEAGARWPDDVNIKALHALELDRAGRSAEALALADQAAASPRPALALLRARGALLAGDPAAAVQRLQHIDPQQLEDKSAPLKWRRERLLGLAFDALEQWPEALDAFTRAQQLAGGKAPVLATLEPDTASTIRRLAAAPGLTEVPVRAPILLCGLPGSGAGQVAALLADQPGGFVRRERFGVVPDFINAPFDPRLLEPLDPSALALLARRYQRPLERAGVAEGAWIIDWVPLLDARTLPAIIRALPGTRLLWVGRAPRDMLLDWLAFGWSAGFAMTNPLDGARWLRQAGEHLQLAADLLPCLRVDAEALLAEHGEAAHQQLADFLGVEALSPGALAHASRKGHGGLPIRFAPGHSAHYRELLSEAFGVLED